LYDEGRKDLSKEGRRMTKRVYKIVDGRVEQVEGPLYEGPREKTTGDDPRLTVDAPAVIIPPKHRSAGE
jgi:hypothetical protein